jgi:endonuclease G
MAKRSNKFLFIIAIAAIVVGIKTYTKMSDSSAKSTDNQSLQTTRIVANAKHYDGLDDVKIPNTLKSQIKEYEGFKLSFNSDNHTPNYVVWELLASETTGIATRQKKFFNDADVAGCPYESDYKKSGYDKGHICPAADQKWSETAMSDCFYLTNICPQDNSLNTGAWQSLEKKERQWAERDSAIIIVSGPIYTESDTKRIGKTGVRVPSAFFKVIIAPYLDTPRGIGFIYPNMTSPGNMQNYSMTIDEVEKITGFDFFYNLPDEIESAVESKASFKEWNTSK